MPGLREQAALDAQAILEDSSGFAWPFTLTSPQGVAAELKGFTTDIGQTIDPDTGQAVAGRRASVAVSLRSLPVIPVVTADSDRKPWIVRFLNILGVGTAWKVIEVLPDRALGVGVFLLEVYQQVVVQLSASVLVLPSLLLSGSFTPLVALSGAVALPQLQLAGSFAPVVELGGTLPLPSLQLAGELAPVVELGGTVALPQLQLAGSFVPAVELGGTVVLPQLQVAGSFVPVVSFGASTLPLPPLQLAGTFSPVVALGGAMALPSLQLAGSFAPAVTLGGTMALPQLQLAGSLVPAVTLGGAMTLPSLQLAGSFTPAVSMAASALTLPSLQLSGSFTVVTSPVGSWLRLAASTITAGKYDGLANVVVPSNPFVQTVAGRRPTAAVAANGLPVCTWSGANVMTWPVVASNNDPAVFGLHLHGKPPHLSGRQRIVHAYFSGAGPRVIFDQVNAGLMIQAVGVYPNGVQWDTPACLTAGVYHSIWFLVNAAGATNADKLKVWVNGIQITGGTFNNNGTGVLSQLALSSGAYLIGGSSDADTPGSPLANGWQTGPNWQFVNSVPTQQAMDAIRLFEVPT